jgi:excisionase family DNA binding protein
LTEEQRDSADPWLTLAEIADELRVNPATVRQWVTKGQLKASRAGVRKWIVRRSDLDRMLEATNVVERGEATTSTAEEQRRQHAGRGHRVGSSNDSRSAVALLQIANDGFLNAIEASAFVPPAPGYVDRLRRLADSCEHMASTLLNASKLAGVGWSPRTNFGLEVFPYEVRAGGNRPGADELWKGLDAALARLVIAITGTEVSAVAHGFRDVADAMIAVADELDREDSWQVASHAG